MWKWENTWYEEATSSRASWRALYRVGLEGPVPGGAGGPSTGWGWRALYRVGLEGPVPGGAGEL